MNSKRFARVGALLLWFVAGSAAAQTGLGNYTYDWSGNITSIGSHTFRYDAFGRLQKSVLSALGTQTYTYDRYGNIVKIERSTDSVAAIPSVDPETNRMDAPFAATGGNLIAQYDAAGNLIEHQQDVFVYDALNVMKETTDPERRLHIYTASDERVMIVVAENNLEKSSEWTLRDAENRVLRRVRKDTGGNWHWKEDYVYGGGRLLAAEVAASERVRHFHLDHLGTPRVITGNGGVQIDAKTYEPFGPRVGSPIAGNEQLEFTGHERDVPTLDYMRARYYQPYLGRFLSVDPGSMDSRFPQHWNRYSYTHNNPINAVDPDGRVTQLVVGQHTKQNPVGHIAIAINGKVYSYGTNYSKRADHLSDWGVSLTAYTTPQNPLRETQIVTLKVTEAEETALQAHLEANNPNAPDAPTYDELTNSCVSVSERGLETAGILPNEPGPVTTDYSGNDLQASAPSSMTPAGLLNQAEQAGLVEATRTVGTKPAESKLEALWNALVKMF